MFESDDRQGRQIDFDRVGLILPTPILTSMNATIVSHIGTPIGGGIRVEDFLVESGRIHANAVSLTDNWGRIDNENDRRSRAGFSHERPDRVVGIVEIDPLKTFITIITLVEGRLVSVEPVEVLNQSAEPIVCGGLREVPVQAESMLPLGKLTELDALKNELLSRMRPHP